MTWGYLAQNVSSAQLEGPRLQGRFSVEAGRGPIWACDRAETGPRSHGPVRAPLSCTAGAAWRRTHIREGQGRGL